jgi:hypothetical protein
VINRYTEGGLSFDNIWAIFSEYYHGQYAPFNELMYLLLYSAFGYSPFWFHLASLFIHIACVCLVFRIVCRLLFLRTGTEDSKYRLIAFFTALIFAIHPVNVESIAWVSASKVPVYSVFYLLACNAFISFIEKRKIKYHICALLLFVCSFFGKEQAVTFPVCALVIIMILNSDRFKGIKLKRLNLLWTLLPFFLLALFFGYVTMRSQAVTGAGMLSDAVTYPLCQRFFFGCYALFEYLFKSVFPFKLSYIYPFPSIVGAPLPSWLLFYPCLLAVIVICLWKYLRRPAIMYGLLFFVIHIAVTLHIIPLSRFAIVADRYDYLSCAGIAFIISFGIVSAWKRVKGKIRILFWTALLAYMLFLGAYAHARTYVWHDTGSLKKELREKLEQKKELNMNLSRLLYPARHNFDWDGNFIRKILLDKTVLTFTLDPANKCLYIDTVGEDEEEIYRYDVNYLYKINKI